MIILWYFPAGAEENHKIPQVKIDGSSTEIQTRHLPNSYQAIMLKWMECEYIKWTETEVVQGRIYIGDFAITVMNVRIQ
jgi:hypothetical protein